MTIAQKILAKYLEDKLPERVRRLITCANFDLYFGPYGVYEPDNDGFVYPGFVTASKEISEAISDLPSEVWVDVDCEQIYESEPQGYEDDETGEYIEPYLENTWYFNHGAIKRALLGKELASTI